MTERGPGIDGQSAKGAWSLIWVLPFSLLLTGACSARADLLPGPPTGGPPSAFNTCPSNSGERLIITVSNQGGKATKSTTTRVLFGPLPAVTLPTRPVLPRDSVSVSFRIPEACYQPDCEITVLVDWLNEVRESNEDNNQAKKVCSGPNPQPD